MAPLVEYRRIFEASPSRDLLLARDLTIVAVTDAWLRAARTERQAVVGRPLFDVIGEDPALRASLARVLESARPETLPARGVTTPILGADGAVEHLLHRVTDDAHRDAERARTLDELLEARRLAAIVDATPDFVAICAMDGRLVYLNRAGRRVVGIADDAELADVDHAALCPAWVYQKTQDEWLPIALRDGAVSGDGALLTRAGVEIPVSFVMLVHRNAAGEPELLSTIARDVSGRSRAEEALRRRERDFRTLAENIPAVVGRFDRALRVVYANRQVEEVTGIPPSRFLGKTGRELGFPEAICRSGDEWLRRVFETGIEATTEVVLPTASGGRDLHAWFGPERNEAGEIETVLAIVRDVTAERQLERELRRKMEELAEADRRKDVFLATLAHELRNPLAPLRNGLEILRRPDGDPAVAERARAMMERQLAHLVRLIDDLLDVSRITSGKLQLRRERVALWAVVQCAVEASRPAIDAGGHALTIELPVDGLELDADPTRLAQVLSNLLINAAKFSDAGGRIALTAARDGDDVVIAVKDDGVGIAAEHLPALFQIFFQVSHEPERSKGGLGIGLSLVRGLVELHGGTVSARSDGPGRGSEFSVRLPLAAGGRAVGASPPSPSPSPSPASPGSARILIVDDNVDAAETLAMVLALDGHDVTVAHDGARGLQLAEESRPQLVLLDIGLPKLNGYEVARRIRQQPWGRVMTLVAITGWGQEDDKRRALEAGFDLHLTKPIAPGALDRLLATTTRRT
jgi:PAS domain S-box-containing protein